MINAILVHIYTSYIYTNYPKVEPQLGQYYIAEYAHHQGMDVRVKIYASTDSVISNLTQLSNELDCSVFGFYVDCANEWIIRRILFDLKINNPNFFFIIGGPQVTGNPQLALKRIPASDVAIVGEGEIPFCQILSSDYRDKNQLGKIKSLAFIDEKGEYIYTGDSKQKQLDIYPFPKRKNYSLDTDIIFDQISTGRGCVGKCSFCFEGSKKNNALRLRPITDVIEEIDYIIENLGNQKYICFLDDTFIIQPKRTKEICNHLINKYNGEYKWFCEARVDILIKNLDILPLLKEAGMFRVQLGGESGSQRVLDAYNKQMRIEDLKKIVKRLYEIGVPSIYINFIIGGAFENLQTFNETLELAKELMDIAPGCAEVGGSIFTPYVGTPMYNTPEKFGIKIIDNNILSGADGYFPFSTTEELTRQKILQLYYLFEGECQKKLDELIKTLPYEVVKNIFVWQREVGLDTNWTKRLKSIEAIDKYFSAVLEHDFMSIQNLTLETIQLYVPHRTREPISDGVTFYRSTFMGEYKTNTPLEEKLLLLSSGKITFAEIVYLISKDGDYSGTNDLAEEIFRIYGVFDKEYLIVWKRDL